MRWTVLENLQAEWSAVRQAHCHHSYLILKLLPFWASFPWNHRNEILGGWAPLLLMLRCPMSTQRRTHRMSPCTAVMPTCRPSWEQHKTFSVSGRPSVFLGFWPPVRFSRNGLFYEFCHCPTVPLLPWCSECNSLQNTVILPSVTSVTERLPRGHGDWMCHGIILTQELCTSVFDVQVTVHRDKFV